MCRNVVVAMVLALSVLTAPSAGQGKRSVAELIAELKKGDAEKLKAIEALEALGEKAADAAPALVALLPGKNEDVRLHVVMAMGKIGKSGIEPLKKAFDSKDPDVRFYAIWGLAFIGPDAKSATSVVVKALGDTSAAVRRKAAYTLGKIDADPDAVVSPLVTALGDKDNDVREAAAEALPRMPKAAVPVLTQALKGDNKELLGMAMRILGKIGADAAPAIPDLEAILIENKGSSDAAADALAGIGAAAVKTLTSAAADETLQVRALALRSLHRIGAPAVGSLVDLLGSKHVDVRRSCAMLLGQMQLNDKSVVIALGFATKDKDSGVRLSALQSIRGMGAGAKLAEPYVVELLTDIDQNLRITAFHTLVALGGDPRPGLKKALEHKDLSIRIKTAVTMTELKLELELAAPILVEGLNQKNEALKVQCANALSANGLRVDEVLPIFLAGLENPTASVRREAAQAIARYGPKGAKAASALVKLLDDPDDSVVGQAMATLNAVGGDPKSLFPAMVKVLRRDDTRLHEPAARIIFMVGPDAIDDVVDLLKKEKAAGVRLACLQTLAMVGPRAKNAVGELIMALDDSQPRHRMTAARALGNIGPDAKAGLVALAKAEKDSDPHVKQIASAAIAQIKADPNKKEFVLQGVLTPGDPLDRVRTSMFHVVHTYQMKKGTRYQIDLTSQWDNYLRLENAQGVQLAQDDDGGGFPNARIIFEAPEDGWYRIIVTSYGPQASGPYTLRVK
ncbi:MAG: HEAT repeat domain-containing protein [Planctomycetes bacterium]|nr:HEAT repeat domain-containing protein [Planctomycetota bacterium]